MTERYSHLAPEHLQKAIRMFDGRLNEKSENRENNVIEISSARD